MLASLVIATILELPIERFRREGSSPHGDSGRHFARGMYECHRLLTIYLPQAEKLPRYLARERRLTAGHRLHPLVASVAQHRSERMAGWIVDMFAALDADLWRAVNGGSGAAQPDPDAVLSEPVRVMAGAV